MKRQKRLLFGEQKQNNNNKMERRLIETANETISVNCFIPDDEDIMNELKRRKVYKGKKFSMNKKDVQKRHQDMQKQVAGFLNELDTMGKEGVKLTVEALIRYSDLLDKETELIKKARSLPIGKTDEISKEIKEIHNTIRKDNFMRVFAGGGERFHDGVNRNHVGEKYSYLPVLLDVLIPIVEKKYNIKFQR